MIRELDRACYTDSAWNGEALGRSFAMPQSGLPPTVDKHSIPELYP
jgi:hypothetical protein